MSSNRIIKVDGIPYPILAQQFRGSDDADVFAAMFSGSCESYRMKLSGELVITRPSGTLTVINRGDWCLRFLVTGSLFLPSMIFTDEQVKELETLDGSYTEQAIRWVVDTCGRGWVNDTHRAP